jgi:hypothetical protein
MLTSIEFSFVLGCWDTGLAYLTCMYGLVLPLFENQPLFVLEHDQAYGHEFLLQPDRSACIAITILVRLQQVNRTLID